MDPPRVICNVLPRNTMSSNVLTNVTKAFVCWCCIRLFGLFTHGRGAESSVQVAPRCKMITSSKSRACLWRQYHWLHEDFHSIVQSSIRTVKDNQGGIFVGEWNKELFC